MKTLYNLFLKTVTTLRREGLNSAKNKSINRFKAWYLSKRIDINSEIHRWEKLKDKYKGERVFIIGNGPSLNKTPLYLLKNEYKMCFNRFNIMSERLNWTPDFFLTTDNLVLSDLVKEFDEIIPNTKYSFFPGVHFRGDNFIDDIKKFKNAYWTVQLMGKGFSEKLPKIYPGGSVIYEGFQILKHLGFSTIYLVGVDMNYKIHRTAKNLGGKGIDIISQKNDDPNHFDPRYFGENRKYHQPEKYVIDNTIKDLDFVADKILDHNFKIINVGFDSKLQSFEKRSFFHTLNLSKEEQSSIFLNLLKNILERNLYEEAKISDFRYIDEPINLDKNIELFYTNIENGLFLINKLIFSHIPVGPFNKKYYFVKRKKTM